jgi:3-methyladenine DNA glycosylase/8-oxoguanine DNA glycosylase
MLESTAERTLIPHAPFHFDGTVCKPSYFPGSDTAYTPGHFWQTMRFEGQVFGIRLDNQGSIEAPMVRLSVFSAQPPGQDQIDRLAAEITCRYDLNTDLRAFYDGFRDDPWLAPALARWRGVRSSSYTSLYEYLVIATVLQNATVRRTVQMMENLFSYFGSRVTFDGRELSAFWEPEAIRSVDEMALRELKLGYRAKTLKRQAESFAAGGLDESRMRELPTAELKRMLLQIYGIGPASVWYLLFGQFKRNDAFEYISPWEQKIYSRLLFNQTLVDAKTILSEVDRRWGAWKMLAAHILFEDLFWQRKNAPVPWLEELIRL